MQDRKHLSYRLVMPILLQVSGQFITSSKQRKTFPGMRSIAFRGIGMLSKSIGVAVRPVSVVGSCHQEHP